MTGYDAPACESRALCVVLFDSDLICGTPRGTHENHQSGLRMERPEYRDLGVREDRPPLHE